MYSPVPSGEQPIEGLESEGGSSNIEYANDSEDGSDDSDDSKEVESPPRTKLRTKANQDPIASQSKAPESSVRNPKRTRMATPDPVEKTAKQPMTVPPKPRKALPRIKFVMPNAST